MSATKFRESPDKSLLTEGQRDLLTQKISDLALKIPGTQLEMMINQLYRELAQAGVSFRPKTYLSDEWGCPQGIPVIGIPFYLADPVLCKLEGELTGIEAETEPEVMMYLRHEAGHAFNYAYRLYKKVEWLRIFGQYSLPYEEEYKPVPFSARFVRHIPGWYSQKHPDDDFAETFAVWLTPGAEWRKVYEDSPALTKLLYVERAAKRYGTQPPVVSDEKLDRPVQELSLTLDDWYTKNRNMSLNKFQLHRIIDEDLRRLFPETDGQPADGFLQTNARLLIREVNRWTGMERRSLRSLFNDLIERVRTLGLKTGPGDASNRIVSVTAFLTALAMNYQFKNQLVES
jgi:hypothetical protein